jgi:hypothetical protein
LRHHEILSSPAIFDGAEKHRGSSWNEVGQGNLSRPEMDEGRTDPRCSVCPEMRPRRTGANLSIHGRGSGAPILGSARRRYRSASRPTHRHPCQRCSPPLRRRTVRSLAAVVETKGGWNDELFTALEGRLFRNYIISLRAQADIYLVGWFDSQRRDPDDSYPVVEPKIGPKGKPKGFCLSMLEKAAA